MTRPGEHSNRKTKSVNGHQPLTDAGWEDLRAPVILREKVGVATDKVQAAASTVYTSPQCFAEVREDFECLLDTAGMKDAAEVGLRVLGERAG